MGVQPANSYAAPLLLRSKEQVLAIMDDDCAVVGDFDEAYEEGLRMSAELLAGSCDWDTRRVRGAVSRFVCIQLLSRSHSSDGISFTAKLQTGSSLALVAGH
ncbi:hypothetical protein N7G274_000347 [Stereocaulon virgatum]|uniref:Uncharacterized protein n=1 Tax=Stereocaulon virgatum TaxID=373712 RepID=A0ABR4AT60_9LECA